MQTAGGGAGGTGVAGAAGGGATNEGTGGRAPYEPRTGPFKMLVLTITPEFRSDAIRSGLAQNVVKEIGAEQGFEVDVSDYADDVTAEGLAPYEAVMFLDASGDFFNDSQQQVFESWITTNQGAFIAVGGWVLLAEAQWPFFKELSGESADHRITTIQEDIQWRPEAADFVAVKGLPAPWPMLDSWWHFEGFPDAPTKPGVMILATVDVTYQPLAQRTLVSWIREWGNVRSFCTSLGHDKAPFYDPTFKQHLAAGIMWAARREALLVPSRL
jgi:hypothetical protein